MLRLILLLLMQSASELSLFLALGLPPWPMPREEPPPVDSSEGHEDSFAFAQLAKLTGSCGVGWEG